jgi:hypothetical protein
VGRELTFSCRRTQPGRRDVTVRGTALAEPAESAWKGAERNVLARQDPVRERHLCRRPFIVFY